MALHMKVNPALPEDRVLVLASEVIQAGGIVVYPTETLYGIGANAWNPEAIAKIHRLKRRPEKKPILLLVSSEDAVRGLVTDISPEARALMKEFWPGPLTLVFLASADVPGELTQGTGTIGVRIPSSGLCRSLVQLSGTPITSTSANVSGADAPQTVVGIEAALGPGVDLYLDGGTLPPSAPSTVVDVSGPGVRLIRAGAIAPERVQKILPNIKL